MDGGQYISPDLIQSLQDVSSSPEDMQRLQLQMELARQMRQGMPKDNEMAGKVVIRQSPLAYLAAGMNNYQAHKGQQDALDQMSSLSGRIRDTKGKFMNALLAQQNPDQVHPSSIGAINGAAPMEQNEYMGDSEGAADPGDY